MSQVLQFERIVPEGKAMGRLADGRAVFCIGPIPGETARVGLRKQKKTYAEAVLREILEASPHRSESTEEHHLTCSPWQGVAYAHQLEMKQEMLAEAFRQNHIEYEVSAMIPSPEVMGYRNRLDFTLEPTDVGLGLAFHRRGSWTELVSLPHGCALGSKEMNAAALDLAEQLGKLTLDPEGVITVRHARTTGNLMTIFTTHQDATWKDVDTSNLGTLVVARPLPGSGAPGKTVFSSSKPMITERIQGLDLGYPYDGFFQTNTPVFELALEQILKASAGSRRIVELYSGVGAIGLPLATTGPRVHGVETVRSAVEFALENARRNGIKTYTAEAVAAEHMDATVLHGADCVILDPPRAGLHPKVTRWLVEAKPQRIVYLSCNPVTQARDIAALAPAYKLEALQGYDMYPHTLHLESLAVLTTA